MCSGILVHYERTVRDQVVRPGRRMRRVCLDTLVHYEQIVRSGVTQLGPVPPVHGRWCWRLLEYTPRSSMTWHDMTARVPRHVLTRSGAVTWHVISMTWRVTWRVVP